MTAPAIEAVDLYKTFGHSTALDGVSFSVAPGTVFGMIGPNGAGKTTTMRILLDIIRPSSGRARVLDTDARNAGPALRRRIGYLPGDLILQGRISGRRLLTQYVDISGPVRPGRIDELAERLRVDLDRPVRKLSKGNKQKLGIIQAFMHEPALLVLDEPTSGLDPLMRQEFLAMVKESKAAGQCVFLSSHVISEIQQAADEVAILRNGRIVRVATVEDLRGTAVRHLRLRVAGTGAGDLRSRLQTLPGLDNLKITDDDGRGAAASATLAGAIAPILAALAVLPLTDLVLEEPDLEESVLSLYTAPNSEEQS
ncbi:ABC transporter ATP-binding protein [Paenarthrobacter sp. Z7-10]|uniref:ABC transporter ATP-binding protein n=1 Tax=Paenarthrobacter sp. Z7-10 TaxID=2787635 RepID=UPI0022A958B8|nr:ABC transporter ATP-binding protein [Paenarthrobacter sp. Z7-10]MCZ2402127.1 ABC transporter ATP-binding protein [Paenarthrobacter sp. Z7-10]